MESNNLEELRILSETTDDEDWRILYEIVYDLEIMKEFLRQAEKGLVGKIIEVPIDRDLWESRADFTYHCLRDSHIHYQALCWSVRGKFSDAVLKERECPTMPATLSTRGQIDTIKLFLEKQYKIPLSTYGLLYDDNFYKVWHHLYAYWFYQSFIIKHLGFFYPNINERINFAGLRLIYINHLLYQIVDVKGTTKDRVKPGANEMKRLSKERDSAIAKVIEEFDIKNLQYFRKDKKLREDFLIKCRSETKRIDTHNVPLSDGIILRKAKKIILKGNASD